MATVRVRLHVDEQGHVTGRVAPAVPLGDYTAAFDVPAAGTPPPLELPVDDEPWDDRVSLRREDLYADEGR